MGLDVGLSGCHVKWSVLKTNKKKKRKRGKIGKVQHAGERETEKGTVQIRALAGILIGRLDGQTISVSAQIRRKYSIRLDEQACGG